MKRAPWLEIALYVTSLGVTFGLLLGSIIVVGGWLAVLGGAPEPVMDNLFAMSLALAAVVSWLVAAATLNKEDS